MCRIQSRSVATTLVNTKLSLVDGANSTAMRLCLPTETLCRNGKREKTSPFTRLVWRRIDLRNAWQTLDYVPTREREREREINVMHENGKTY